MTIKTDFVQIGASATPANNFIFNPDGAGGLKIQRGTVVNGVPSPVQDILTINAAGEVNILQPNPWIVTNPTPVPTSGGAFGSAIAVLRTRKEGKTVFYNATVDITSVGTATGGIQLALPYPAAATSVFREWNGSGRESRQVGYAVLSWVQQAGSVMQMIPGSGAIANNHLLNASGFYESAA